MFLSAPSRAHHHRRALNNWRADYVGLLSSLGRNSFQPFPATRHHCGTSGARASFRARLEICQQSIHVFVEHCGEVICLCGIDYYAREVSLYRDQYPGGSPCSISSSPRLLSAATHAAPACAPSPGPLRMPVNPQRSISRWARAFGRSTAATRRRRLQRARTSAAAARRRSPCSLYSRQCH